MAVPVLLPPPSYAFEKWCSNFALTRCSSPCFLDHVLPSNDEWGWMMFQQEMAWIRAVFWQEPYRFALVHEINSIHLPTPQKSQLTCWPAKRCGTVEVLRHK